MEFLKPKFKCFFCTEYFSGPSKKKPFSAPTENFQHFFWNFCQIPGFWTSPNFWKFSKYFTSVENCCQKNFFLERFSPKFLRRFFERFVLVKFSNIPKMKSWGDSSTWYFDFFSSGFKIRVILRAKKDTLKKKSKVYVIVDHLSGDPEY